MTSKKLLTELYGPKCRIVKTFTCVYKGSAWPDDPCLCLNLQWGPQRRNGRYVIDWTMQTILPLS